jgi:DNA-binding MarR family transcriptional regulator
MRPIRAARAVWEYALMAVVKFGFLSGLLGFRLKEASQALLVPGEKRLAPLGISPQQFTILAMVSLNPGITQSALIKSVYITRSTCSDLIEQLIQAGFAKRTPIDRRSNGLTLTAEGEAVFLAAKAEVERNAEQATSHMDPQEVQELIRLLAKFSAGARS